MSPHQTPTSPDTPAGWAAVIDSLGRAVEASERRRSHQQALHLLAGTVLSPGLLQQLAQELRQAEHHETQAWAQVRDRLGPGSTHPRDA